MTTYHFHKGKDPRFLLKRYKPYRLELIFSFSNKEMRDIFISIVEEKRINLNEFFHSTTYSNILFGETAEERKKHKFEYYSQCEYFLISFKIDKIKNTVIFVIWNKTKTPIAGITRQLSSSFRRILKYYDYYKIKMKRNPPLITMAFETKYSGSNSIPTQNVIYKAERYFKVSDLEW